MVPTLEFYTGRYTVYTAKTARNRPIQHTRSVPRVCRYTARSNTVSLYSIQRIHYTAPYADPLPPGNGLTHIAEGQQIYFAGGSSKRNEGDWMYSMWTSM